MGGQSGVAKVVTEVPASTERFGQDSVQVIWGSASPEKVQSAVDQSRDGGVVLFSASEFGGFVESSDEEGNLHMALLTAVDGRLGWTLWESERVNGHRRLGDFTGTMFVLNRTPRGLKALDSDRIRPKLKERRLLSSCCLETSVQEEIGRVMKAVDLKWKILDRRPVVAGLAVAGGLLAAGCAPPALEGATVEPTPTKVVVKGSEGKGEGVGAPSEDARSDDKEVADPGDGPDPASEPEPDESSEVEVLPTQWEYFNQLNLDEAKEFVLSAGPELAFEIGEDVNLVVTDIHGNVLSEVVCPFGLLSEGFFVLNRSSESDIYDKLNNWVMTRDDSEDSLWVEFDESSFLPYSGGEWLGNCYYRVFVKLGDYDVSGNNIRESSKSVEQKIRRMGGIVGVSGKVNFVSHTMLDHLVNQSRGLRAIHHSRDLMTEGIVDIEELLGIDPEHIDFFYNDVAANTYGGYFDGVQIVQGFPAANVCSAARMVYCALANYGLRMWAVGKDNLPMITERSIHPVGKDVYLDSFPPYDVLYFDGASWKLRQISSRKNSSGEELAYLDLYRFIVGNPSSLMLPFNGMPNDRYDLGVRGITDVKDSNSFPTDVMVGPNSDFRGNFPPESAVRATTRIVPLNYSRNAGSYARDSEVYAIFNQIAFSTVPFDEEDQLRVEIENLNTIHALDDRSESFEPRYKEVADARLFIMNAVQNGDIGNLEEVTRCIDSIALCPVYGSTIDKYFTLAREMYIKGYEASEGVVPGDDNMTLVCLREFKKLLIDLSKSGELRGHISTRLFENFDSEIFQHFSLAVSGFDLSTDEAYRDDQVLIKCFYAGLLAILHDVAFFSSYSEDGTFFTKFWVASIQQFLAWAHFLHDGGEADGYFK